MPNADEMCNKVTENNGVRRSLNFMLRVMDDVATGDGLCTRTGVGKENTSVLYSSEESKN